MLVTGANDLNDC